MRITISGTPGSGKGEIRKILSEKYSLPSFSVGDLRREYAQSRGMTIQEFNKFSEKNPIGDRQADEYQVEWSKKNKKFILEGRLSYHFIPNSIKLFITGEELVLAKRILDANRSSEKKVKSIKEQARLNKERCESDSKRYKKEYGIKNCYNKNQFDIVIDSTNKSIEKVVEEIDKKIQEHLGKLTPKINDIFSKEKVTPRETSKEKIIIDYREKNSLVPGKIKLLGGDFELKELKVGDYLVKDTIIERKEVRDFAHSIINGRLKRQLKEIKQYENYFLIVEGNLNKIENIHPNAIRGFILSIATNYKVPMIFTSNEEETAKYLLILSKKQNKESSLNPGKINLSPTEQQKFILQSFSGIGPKKSTELLEKFSTLKKIFNAKEKDLEPVLGKKSKEFINWIKWPYKN